MKQMKTIFQLAENVSLESGGLRTVVVNLDNYINENKNYKSIVVTNKKEQEDSYFEFPSHKLQLWNYSESLKKHLSKEISNSDILHLHGVFMHIQYLSSKLAQKNNHPYIVTPHGMLEPWLLKDKRLKKKIYFELILNKILSKSTVLHAITPLEKESLFELTKHKNIVEIPNFIYHESIPKFEKYNPKEEEYLLFVGRIHPKKGLDILLESFSAMENKKLKLKIVGNTNDYSIKLQKKCIDLGIDKRVDFLGGVFSDEKYELFSNSKAFVAPSYS
jgi:glycosyltransferase involved in cell wall biosynthesis